MMNESQITVGELSSFLLYAAFVGASIGGRAFILVPSNMMWLAG